MFFGMQNSGSKKFFLKNQLEIEMYCTVCSLVVEFLATAEIKTRIFKKNQSLFNIFWEYFLCNKQNKVQKFKVTLIRKMLNPCIKFTLHAF